jgi:hypothetical protein
MGLFEQGSFLLVDCKQTSKCGRSSAFRIRLSSASSDASVLLPLPTTSTTSSSVITTTAANLPRDPLCRFENSREAEGIEPICCNICIFVSLHFTNCRMDSDGLDGGAVFGMFFVKIYRNSVLIIYETFAATAVLPRARNIIKIRGSCAFWL